MTDQTIPTDEDRRIARDWAEHIINTPDTSLPMETAAAHALMALLPPRPTLADMPEDERAECQWMQADTEHWGRTFIIIPNLSDGRAALLDRRGKVPFEEHTAVTPRPDLPRLEWPGDTPAPAPALPEGWRLAGHQKYGRVVVTNPTPNRDGNVFFVLPADDPLGCDWMFCKPDELTFLDGPSTKENHND